LLSVEDDQGGSVELALLRDPRLTEEQRRVLLDLYTSFVSEDDSTQPPTTD
jgi:hypothetical protein